MKGEQKTAEVNRRGFLKGAGLAAGAAGAATLASTSGAAAASAEAPAKSAGYRETEHVRTYYDLARF